MYRMKQISFRLAPLSDYKRKKGEGCGGGDGGGVVVCVCVGGVMDSSGNQTYWLVI